MKKVLFAASFCCCLLAAGQKTVQFSDPLPPNYTLVQQVDKAFYGQYRNTLSGSTYLFDETGVSIVSTVVAFVTREQVRESSTIQVRGNYLFGVAKGDSLPCVAEGDRYYYGVQHKQVIVGAGSSNQLTKLDNKTYIVNFLEGSFFEPSLFTFDATALKVVHADLGDKPYFSKLLKVNTIERFSSPVDILAPSAAQWSELRTQLFTGQALNYLKEAQ